MSEISYKVSGRNGDYVATTVVPANHSEEPHFGALDVAVLSKIELGQRVATEEQTRNLAKFFGVNETEAQARRMVEKFRQEGEENPEAARRAVSILAEEAGLYRTKQK